jgi:hypothetical protein
MSVGSAPTYNGRVTISHISKNRITEDLWFKASFKPQYFQNDAPLLIEKLFIQTKTLLVFISPTQLCKYFSAQNFHFISFHS